MGLGRDEQTMERLRGGEKGRKREEKREREREREKGRVLIITLSTAQISL